MSNETIIRNVSIAVLLFYLSLLIVNVTINGLMFIFVLLSSSLIGFIVLNICLKKWNDFDSPFPNRAEIVTKLWNINEKRVSTITVCLVCGDNCCERHDSRMSVDAHPWKGITIDKRVDDALDEILTLTLNQHIQLWYEEIAYDMNNRFDAELRHILRCLISGFVRRIDHLNAIELLLNKLPNVLIHHVEVFMHGKRHSKGAQYLEESVLNEYGHHLHPALVSRDDEIKWLRMTVESILPHLLPPKYLNCNLVHTFFRELLSCSVLLPVMDVVADPDRVNALLTLLFDKTPMVQYPNNDEINVEILEKFVTCKRTAEHANCLGIELKQILDDQQLLFLFTRFAKDEGFVNLVQFLLHIDAFSQKTLNPDLTREQLQELHDETCKIFNSYFIDNCADHIPFDKEIFDSVREVVYGNVEDVEKLRTTASLYRAHDYVYNLLENYYCPLFLQSDSYFKLLCGQRWTSFESTNTKKSHSMNTRSKSMHSIDGSEQSIRTDDNYDGVSVSDDVNDQFDYESKNSESVSEDGFFDGDHRLRDLSSWRVSITAIESKLDSNGKEYDAFIIDVQRLDMTDDEKADSNWEVERRYNEFYVLEAKLKEFHGDKVNGIFLPPKRSFLKINKLFMESRRAEFEKFLKRLLTYPHLKGSELVYNFLKSSSEEFTTGFLPDIKIGKIIKNVPAKLTKERGQHLEFFLLSLIASTEQSRPKPSKNECSALLESPEEFATLNLQNKLYGDNMMQWKNDEMPNVNQNNDTKRIYSHLEYVYDYILFFTLRLYNIEKWIQNLIILLRPLLRKTLQSITEWYLDLTLKTSVITPQRIVDLIHLLRDALYFEKDLPLRSRQQRQQRSQSALKNTKEFFPNWIIHYILGKEKHEEVIFMLFSMLQYPLLNKQLLYIMLDIFVKDLFPEILLTNNCD